MTIALSQFGTGVARGATQWVGNGTLAAGALTSPTIDLNTQEQIYFLGSVKAGAAANIDLYFNSDTTATNYWRGDVSGGASANNSRIQTTAASGDMIRFYGTIWRDCDDHVVLELVYSRLSTSGLISFKQTYVWVTTATNLTSFQIKQASGSFTSGNMTAFSQSTKGVIPTSYYGSTFPPSPQTTDPPFYNTTLKAWGYWNGTNWLSVEEFPMNLLMQGTMPATNTNDFLYRWTVPSDQQIYLTKLHATTYVQTTSSGTQYWTPALASLDSANAVIATIATLTTISDAANTWINKDQLTLNVLVSTSAKTLRIASVKVSTPGTLILVPQILYRTVLG